MIASTTLALVLAAAIQKSPNCPLSTGGVADGPALTFERIADNATAIVEATVQSVVRVASPPSPGSPIPRDHAVLLATRVIKGPDSIRLFTTNQILATGLFELRKGGRFILFLSVPDPRMPASPERPDLPAYGLAGGGRATLCIDAGKVHVSRNGQFLRDRFEGVDLEKAVGDIQAYLKARGK